LQGFSSHGERTWVPSRACLWLSAYACATASAGELLRRPRVRRTIDGLTGGVLIGLGLRLATEER